MPRSDWSSLTPVGITRSRAVSAVVERVVWRRRLKQQGVRKATNGQQEPWRYGSLDGDFYFKAANPVDNSKAQQELVERAVQESIKRSNEKSALERAELQRTIKAEQDEALRRAN